MQTIAISIKSVGVSCSYPALFSWAPVKPYDQSDNCTVAISNVIIHVKLLISFHHVVSIG